MVFGSHSITGSKTPKLWIPKLVFVLLDFTLVTMAAQRPKVFFDITIGGKASGRLVMVCDQLYGVQYHATGALL